MSVNLREFLFTGTALVALGAAASAYASTITVSGGDESVISDPNAVPAISFLTDNKATVADGVSITGNIVTSTDHQGVTEFVGATTVNGNIGAAALDLKSIIISPITKVMDTFKGTIYADSIEWTSLGGIINFNSDVHSSGGFDFNVSMGTLNLADGVIFYGDIFASSGGEGGAGFGVLTLNGNNTVTGNVGIGAEGHLGLSAVNAGVNGTSSTFQGDVRADTINITGLGNVTFDQNLIGQVNFEQDGTAYLTYGYSQTGGIITGGEGGPGVGHLVIQGGNNSSFSSGAINGLNTVTLEGENNSLFIGGNFAAPNITYLNGNTITASGSFVIKAGQDIQTTVTGAEGGGILLGGHINAGMGSSIDPGTIVHIATATQDIHPGDIFTVVSLAPCCEGAPNVVGSVADPISPYVDFTQVPDENNLTFVVSAVNFVPPAMLNWAPTALADIATRVLDLTNDQLIALRNDETDAAGMTGVSAGSAYSVDGAVDWPRGYVQPATTLGDGMSMWVQGYGQYTQQQARQGFAGYRAEGSGITIGADTPNILKDSLLGLALNYASVNVRSRDSTATTNHINNSGFILYGGHDFGSQTFMRAQAGYSYNTIESTRFNSDGIGGKSSASYSADQYMARVLAGREHALSNGMTLTPNLQAEYVKLQARGYTETGSSLNNLTVSGQDYSSLRPGAGLETSWKIRGLAGDRVEPLLRVVYERELLDRRVETTAAFVSGGPSFSTKGSSPARDILVLGAQATYVTPAGWDVFARYDFTYKQDYHSSDAIVRATMHF